MDASAKTGNVAIPGEISPVASLERVQNALGQPLFVSHFWPLPGFGSNLEAIGSILEGSMRVNEYLYIL
jgi:hypothetical protein